MPTVVGIRVKCPECGATMQASSDVVRCAYCGTESRVQRRTAVFQVPVPLPPPRPQQYMPPRVAVQARSAGLPILVGVLTTIIPLIIVMVFVVGPTRAKLRSPSRSEPAAAPARAPIHGSWNGPLLFADVDGDGAADIIGIVRYVSIDAMHLTAYSSKTGARLWESPSLGTYSDVYNADYVVDKDTIYYGSHSSQRLLAYDLKTGAPRWQVEPPEVVESFCYLDNTFSVALKDETNWTIAPDTGALTKRPRARCRWREDRTGSSFARDVTNPPGMSLDRIYTVAEGWIARGSKSPGTAVPMLVSIDKKRKERWRTVIPPVDPMSAHRYPFATLTYDDTQIALSVSYDNDKHPPRILTFDRATGERVLDIPLDLKNSWHSEVPVVLQPDALYITLGSGLHAYDRTTGALRWVIAPSK